MLIKKILFEAVLNVQYTKMMGLLEWNKTGAVSSTNTGSTVLDRLVCQREISHVVTDHFWLDFNLKVDKLTN